ncbi:MAG: hypothetical protein KDD56_07850 [Bdellovibrionales bacterium]|nr:hypothetical protein [Bdellovibrionales bacterium]
MPVSILASTAGRETKLKSHANIKIEPYLPGDKATARSSLVICNGGSATTYAALRQGVPIVGVASNMDQLLTMSYVKKARAGILIRPSELNVSTLESAVLKILDSDFYKLGVKKVAKDFAEYNSNVLFKTFIDNFFDLTQAKTFTL